MPWVALPAEPYITVTVRGILATWPAAVNTSSTANEAQLCHPEHYTKRQQPLQVATMSDSQSPTKDVDQGAQSPEDEGQMNDTHDPQAAGLGGYEFEGVKEQDRWLPIANGRSSQLHHRVVICPSRAPSLQPCIVGPPCLTIRQRRLSHPAPPRLTNSMNLMLTFATLLQSLAS